MYVVARAALPIGEWGACVLAHPDGWFFHSEQWLAYQIAYRAVNADTSFAVVDASGVVAIVPWLITTQDGRREFSLSGTPTPRFLATHQRERGPDGARLFLPGLP